MSYSLAEEKVRNDYASTLLAGNFKPTPTAIRSLSSILLIGWLLSCGSLSESRFQRSRLPAFLCIASLSLWNMLYTRSIGVIGSIGVGLSSVLTTIIAINFVLLHDPRWLRFQSTGFPARQTPSKSESVAKDGSNSALVWEPIPKLIWQRIFWVFDLVTGFRGIHWSWKPSPLPTKASLGDVPPRRTLSNSFRFIFNYITIDFVKCLMISDPFFINYPTRTAFPYIAMYTDSSFGLYTYRMLLVAAGIFLSIDLMFSFAILLQLDVLGPGILGPNASPIMFPRLWGSPRAVLCKGLRGFWGETWHQIFRKHFVSIGDAIANLLLGDRNSSSVDARSMHQKQNGRSKQPDARVAIRTIVVFSLSGMVHAAASYTLLGPTNPWSSFLFFALQPFGIAIQNASSRYLVNQYFTNSGNPWESRLRQSSNLIFTIIWLWVCSGLLFNDLTSGGVWMFEPVPISFIRGFGLSKDDNRLWCW